MTHFFFSQVESSNHYKKSNKNLWDCFLLPMICEKLRIIHDRFINFKSAYF